MTRTEPLRELLEAGLHRLAQPLTTSMWVVEEAMLRGEAEPKVDVSRLSCEVRRAVGVLNAIRAVLEGEPGEPDIVDATEHVEALQPQWQAHCDAGGVKLKVRMPHDRCCLRMDPTLLRMVCDESSRQLLQFATAGAEISIALADGAEPQLSFCLRTGADAQLDEQQQRAFTGPFDPFDTPGYAFAGPPCDAFLLRISLAAAGCQFHSEATAEYAELRWTLPPAVSA